MTILLILFWSLIFLVVYTYALFPMFVALRAGLFPRPYEQSDIEPSVSVILAAHNEQACIAAKIENVLQLDYPHDKIELIVASDGSTDATESIVARYSGPRVRLLALPRCGKAKALNTAVAAARSQVLVFTDANSMFEPSAIRALVRPLADTRIGGVAGDQRYVRSGTDTSCGERSYWNFDRWLKQAESRAGNVISATGAIYAIRRELFQPVPEGVTDDFVTSTRVIAQRHRLVFQGDAVAWEPVAKKQSIEFGRKTRIITRGLRGVWIMRSLLNPFRHGFYALQLFSHKVLRRLMVVPLLLIVALTWALWPQGIAFQTLASLEVAFFLLAFVGAIACCRGIRQPKLLALPMYFCLVNFAALVALGRIMSGRSVVVWQPQRTAGDEGLVA